RRQIDRNVERELLADLFVPIGQCAGGLVHRPSAERQNQAALLCDRDELGWADLAAIFMVPAGKRFEASNPPRLEIDERLIEQLELILLERPPKLCLDREAAPRLGRLMGLIDLGDS